MADDCCLSVPLLVLVQEKRDGRTDLVDGYDSLSSRESLTQMHLSITIYLVGSSRSLSGSQCKLTSTSFFACTKEDASHSLFSLAPPRKITHCEPQDYDNKDGAPAWIWRGIFRGPARTSTPLGHQAAPGDRWLWRMVWISRDRLQRC